jgi:LruC domain-containing protein
LIEKFSGGIMRKILIILSLIATMMLLISCSESSTDISNTAQNINEVEVPEGFDWDFTKTIEVVISARDQGGNPVEGKEISLFKTSTNLVVNSTTDSNGELRVTITVPETSRNITLEYDGQQETVPIVGNQVNRTIIVEPERSIRANGTLYVPGQNSVMTLLFEDNWPIKGDYDFNDMVVEAWGKLRYESDYLRYVEMKATVIASGATYHNGFEVMFETTAFPNTSLGDVITLTAEDINGVPLFATSGEVTAAYGTDVTWDTFNSQLYFKFFDDVYDVMPLPTSYLSMNTLNEAPWTDPITIKIRIDYNQLIAFDAGNPIFNLNDFNAYVVVNGIAGYEIHMPGEPYTANFSQFALFSTGDDNTPITGLASPQYETEGYRTVNGLSWGLKLEGQLEYPREQADMIMAYPELADYFAGNQGIFDNWWQPHPDDDYSEGYIMNRGDLTPAEQNAPVGD